MSAVESKRLQIYVYKVWSFTKNVYYKEKKCLYYFIKKKEMVQSLERQDAKTLNNNIFELGFSNPP